jgi:hypothetical protein
MKVIIDIDDKLYKIIKDPKQLATMVHANRCAEAVENGIPIPKGHGAIKDVSQIEIPMCEDRTYEKWVQVAINSAPTIIKADKEE